MSNYQPIYQIISFGIQEIKMSPAVLLLIMHPLAGGSIIPLRLLAIKDGSLLKVSHHPSTMLE
jgi:hypothetical protein